MTAAEEFWAWSLDVYGRDGIAAQLLALQDRFLLNVNILLWSCWCAERFSEPSDLILRKAIDLCSRWSRDVTEPLRSARRALKSPPLQADAAAAAAFKERIAAVELESERMEQSMLAALAAAELTPDEGGIARARRTLARYAGLSGAVARLGFSMLPLDDLARSVFP